MNKEDFGPIVLILLYLSEISGPLMYIFWQVERYRAKSLWPQGARATSDRFYNVAGPFVEICEREKSLLLFVPFLN